MDYEFVKNELIRDMTEYLIDKGFDSDTSYKLAKDFWKRNFEKLRKALHV